MVAACRDRKRHQERGVTMVEVAILMSLFFAIMLGVIELSRIMFLWNTLANVTRRAAVTVAVSAPAADHSAALTAVAFGGVPLTDPVIDGSYFTVDYLNRDNEAVPAPASAGDNLRNCAQDPEGLTQCVRFVRVRLCQPGGEGDCERVPFEPLFPLGGVTGIEIRFPTFETIVPAGALGYRPGTAN
ncbi:MAG TPA: TadE family protein [Telluria sp.]